MSNIKKIQLLVICLILMLSVSGCELLKSLFSEVTLLDFEKRPNYAVNKSFYLMKKYDSGVIESKIQIKNTQSNQRNSYELISSFNSSKSEKKIRINHYGEENYLEMNGVIIEQDQDRYLLINDAFSKNLLINKLPKNEWIENNEIEKTDSFWINLYNFELGYFTESKIWSALKNKQTLLATNQKNMTLRELEGFIFDINIDKETLRSLTNALENDIIHFLTETLNWDTPKDDLHKLIDGISKTEGSIWIQKKSMVAEKINLSILATIENQDYEIDIDFLIQPNKPDFLNLEIENSTELSSLITEKEMEQDNTFIKLFSEDKN
jgi:hypothetical protein